MSPDQPMLDVDSEDTFTRDFLSSLLQQDTSHDLDTAIQKPLPESPGQSTGVTANADAQDMSSEAHQQPVLQPCSVQQNDVDSTSSQGSRGTGFQEPQRSGTPSSVDEGLKSSEKAEDLIEGFSSLWTEKEENVNRSANMKVPLLIMILDNHKTIRLYQGVSEQEFSCSYSRRPEFLASGGRTFARRHRPSSRDAS